MKRLSKVFPVLAVIVLMIAACASEVSPAGQSNGGEEVSAGGGEAGSGDSSPLGELGFELGQPELKSTDPGSVSLDGGSKPQIVEFFAFW